MHPKRTLAVLAVGALAVLSAACGGGSNPKSADAQRTVNVEMVDNAFKPENLAVAKGETVRFVFTNNGKAKHEAFFGTVAAQEDHEKTMSDGAKSGGHDVSHMGAKDRDVATVSPGKTGDLTITFDKAGAFQIGCHQPGHYAGGMKLAVTVS